MIFSYPIFTYIIEDSIYYGIFNVFNLKIILIPLYEVSMGDARMRESFTVEYSARE